MTSCTRLKKLLSDSRKGENTSYYSNARPALIRYLGPYRSYPLNVVVVVLGLTAL